MHSCINYIIIPTHEGGIIRAYFKCGYTWKIA